MASAYGLHQFLVRSAVQEPDRTAIENPATKQSITYRDLDALARRVSDRLQHLGVRPGDRVGIYLDKSINAIAAIYGALYAGAAYVPVDPEAPAKRNAFIHHNCAVSAVVIGEKYESGYTLSFNESGPLPPRVIVPDVDGDFELRAALAAADEADPARTCDVYSAKPDDLAYILYTSGSTGKPKGVILTHENGISYVDWCTSVFHPRREDRCSSHAPLHFDLSILDLYMTGKHGATLVLIPSGVGKDPAALAPLISTTRISIWYSAPSILSLLAQYGNLDSHDYGNLRMVFFAGEVFPIKHLRSLKKLWPEPEYYNLYGPTETNVCTYFRVPDEIPGDRTQPFPIGVACEHLETRVIDPDGNELPPGQEGELIVRGPAVTQGYWNLPDRNADAFHVDQSGDKWYKTGDLVIEDEAGCYDFLGRRDRMIKKRGYRIELGEIESCLYEHPDIEEAAVIARTSANGDVEVHAFYSSCSGDPLSVIKLKIFCSERIPRYMVPDFFKAMDALPRTSTGKADYQTLKAAQTSRP